MSRATEMKEYFQARGYPDELVNNDLRKVPTARSTLLTSTPTSHNESNNTKVPLVKRTIHSTSAPNGSCLTISTSCPLIPRHAGFSPNLCWYHIGASETSVISLYTPLMPRSPPLMAVHCPTDGLDARRAST